jgi:hypothetical protein
MTVPPESPAYATIRQGIALREAGRLTWGGHTWGRGPTMRTADSVSRDF